MLPPPDQQDADSIALGIDVPTSTAAAIIQTAAATIANVMASPSSSPSDPSSGEGEGECRLLGPFALIVQAALGGLALLALVYKRWRERPQRPVKIWFFDASKQVFGSALLHIANVFMSMLTSGRFSVTLEPRSATAGLLLARDGDDGEYIPNPCSWYLLNLGIDTTIGIPILIVLLRLVTALVALTPLGKPAESIQSGNYGNPPSAWWWLKQSVMYFCGLLGMKLCVLIIFLMIPQLSHVGDWALSWTEGNERLQVVFVMMIFPLIMNAMQYYIIDSFIKKQETDHERLPSEDPDEHSRRRYDDEDSRDSSGGSNEPDDRPSSSDVMPVEGEEGERVKMKGHVKDEREEYDPAVDGHAPTVVGSSSNKAKPAKVTPELYPKE